MPYQLQNLTPPQIARLDEVPIARQEQIIDQTGEPLRLVTSYYLVKNASANFSVPHETAEQLDATIYALLTRKGFLNGTMQTAKPEAVTQVAPAAIPEAPKQVKPSIRQSGYERSEQPKPFSITNYPLVKKFMPLHQQRVVSGFKEERESILDEVEKMLSAIPKLRAQSKISLLEQTVFAHYFYGQSDWFILEYDSREDMFFGYVILNGDSQMSESGFIGRQELTENGRVELDFHWKPLPLREALHHADPDFFQVAEKAAPAEPPAEKTGESKRTPPPPRFKKWGLAAYKDFIVQILDDGVFDPVAQEWIYLAQDYNWSEADRLPESSLQPVEFRDWRAFVEGQSYRHHNGKTYQFDGLVTLGGGEKLATWRLGGKRVGAPIPNLPGYFKTANSTAEAPPADTSKRLRLAQAKAKAQAARIRILKLKSQQAA